MIKIGRVVDVFEVGNKVIVSVDTVKGILPDITIGMQVSFNGLPSKQLVGFKYFSKQKVLDLMFVDCYRNFKIGSDVFVEDDT